MKIGIDLDDTICCTEEMIDVYCKIYCNEKYINESDLWSDELLKKEFLKKYLKKIYNNVPLKKNVVNSIKKLKKMGYNIYIISARTNNYINTDMKKLIQKYLEKHKIFVDSIIINAGDKVSACIENNIDFMIEDNLYNCKKLKNAKINTILFDDKNSNLNYKNRVSNWKEILKIFN